jgi:hypothetical protein
MNPYQFKMIKDLRNEGYAIVWFEPSELSGANPRELEDSMTEGAMETLSEEND